MPKLSATIITLNEQNNIKDCISSLKFCDEIIVLDSGSTDRTKEFAKEMGATVHENPWLGYGQQKNKALEFCKGDWVLNIDADERVTSNLKEEILSTINSNPEENGFFIPRLTYFCGKPIKNGGWYPDYQMRLAIRERSRWTEPEVHELLMVEGEVGWLKNAMDHYSFPTVKSQIQTNMKYSALGAKKLREKSKFTLFFGMLLRPPIKFIECYFAKLGFLDGLQGFIIAMNAAHSIFMKYSQALVSYEEGKN
jgi:glycosyltransferase involved in cell wall biosynthesis